MKQYTTPNMYLVTVANEDIVRTSLQLGGNNGEGNADGMPGIDFSEW